MRRHTLVAATAATLLAALVTPANAFWIDSFVDHCEKGYHINMRWPSPYLCPDRVAAHAPFNAMVKNGWRRQNLMGAHHFSPDGAKLTQAGELKVRWIMTQTPPAYRRMFVERDFQQEVTQQRIETVREFSNQIAMGQTVPEVLETHIVSEGRPAKDVADVSQNYRENMRPVALPTTPLSQGSE